MSKMFIKSFLLTFFIIAQEVEMHHINPIDNDSNKKEEKSDKDISKDEKKSFAKKIEDLNKIDGLFNIYYDQDNNKALLEILPNQLNIIYLCNITRESGDGMMFDSGSMLNEFPFYFKKVGQRIQMIHKNVSFRAKKGSPSQRAVDQSFSNSLFGSTKILSKPHPKTKAILINLNEIFVQDINYVSYITGEMKMKYSMDKNNSYISEIKSFPYNTEIDIVLHFKNAKPNSLYTLPDSRSMMHKYHYSLSMIQETNYKPRIADDRVGHFLTIYQDYSNILSETPYVRYINRWHLEKSNPNEIMSKPKEPIVFWLENTIPEKFRGAIKEGILLWNKAFEKVGYKDAIIVKQMPDDAEWDPADVRYNTIRWIITPGGGYAVGPSRANPYTGEIYDADIRISADYVRWFSNEFEDWITPLSDNNVENNIQYDQDQCSYAFNMQKELAFGWSMLESRELVNIEDMDKYIHDGLVDLAAHEVGHTLGLRHNFKASSIYSLKQLQNKEFTKKNGVTGSVMDYNPVNISPKGEPQGDWYHTTIGKYDEWAIEYAYTPFDSKLYISEEIMLNKIASKVSDPLLQYGTDEDTRGSSIRGMDPMCNLFDLGKDPIEYAELRINLSKELWDNILINFEVDGERYQKIRRVFNQGWGEYRGAIGILTKFIGGSYIYRDHIGDPGNRKPFNIVPAITQRRALDILNNNIFHKDAFLFSPDLLNKLMPERFWNFKGTVWNMNRLDYPIHDAIDRLYSRSLYRLYNPLVLNRLIDSELRYEKGEDIFSITELFSTLRRAIWDELYTRENVNSFRRILHKKHLVILTEILENNNSSMPYDAVSLAYSELVELNNLISNVKYLHNLDNITKAHYSEISSNIKAILEPEKNN